MARRVLVLHTGGTIGMAASADGFRPMAGFGEVLRRRLAAGSGAALPECEVIELGELIDSANLQPAHWRAIAEALIARWEDYDGFVVLHGTDTMAWTASALSFMLHGTDKPVILTGAQIPLLTPRSDAPGNLETALLLAAEGDLREVGLYFGGRLFRGNRSSKLKTDRFDAFGSPNFPPLAEVGIGIDIHRTRLLSARRREFSVPRFDPEAVAVLTVYPGIPARMVAAVTDAPRLRGVVLRSYGVGNVPDADPRLIDALGAAVARGVVVVNVTQCAEGSVAQGTYATGVALERAGVVAGGDMTLEAAFAKLHFLAARGDAPAAIREQMGRALCGERS